MRILRRSDKGFEQELEVILAQRSAELTGVEEEVRLIIEAVRREGDGALNRYASMFDGVDIPPDKMEVPRDLWAEALVRIDADALRVLKKAAEQIRTFHSQQLRTSWFDTTQGVVRGQLVRPLAKAGVYVPGGKAAYPSSLLMNVIPAKVAGVKEVVVVTPPSPSGVNPVILAAAHIAGADRLLQVGGAGAIAALAYGTAQVPRVDIIVGPGNAYVAAAKRLLFGVVMVDMVAGPSEILVLADGSAPARFVAADLISQAEHDELAWPILVTDKEDYALKVADEVQGLLQGHARRMIAAASIDRHGLIIVVRDITEGMTIANMIAPEHLELCLEDPFRWLGDVHNAGAVFLGPYTPEAVGDYLGGPNHVLPTGGTARFSSPLGVGQFQKWTNILSYSSQALAACAEDVARLARLEGLEGHALAVEVRGKEVAVDGKKGGG